MAISPHSDTVPVRPMPLWQALLHFGLSTLLFRLSLYAGTPVLIGWGLSPFVAQRLRNTWPALLIHLQNGIVLLLIVAMVLGMA